MKYREIFEKQYKSTMSSREKAFDILHAKIKILNENFPEIGCSIDDTRPTEKLECILTFRTIPQNCDVNDFGSDRKIDLKCWLTESSNFVSIQGMPYCFNDLELFVVEIARQLARHGLKMV
jgi:hypothetical protein